MQNIATIARQPMLLALLLSIALHAAMLHRQSIYAPPVPHLETGRTVVHLTLVPSLDQMQKPDSISEAATGQRASGFVANGPEALMEPVPSDVAVETAAVDATREASKGITADAAATSAFRPSYPRISRQRGEEGTVIIAVQVLSTGSTGSIEILTSSGYRRLDEAAVQGVRHTTFTPALLLGRAFDSTTTLSYTFRLTHE